MTAIINPVMSDPEETMMENPAAVMTAFHPMLKQDAVRCVLMIVSLQMKNLV